MKVAVLIAIGLLMIGNRIAGQNAGDGHACERTQTANYDGAPWCLKGAGVVCCPCRVPCPCRRNGPPSYGHCEATMYLHISEGRYGATDLNGIRLIDSGGACSMSYHKLSALYFDDRTSGEQQLAVLKLIASMFSGHVVEFSHIRTVHIVASELDGRIFRISIPGVLRMEVDRNWGHDSAPFPWTAAVDHFSNALQYVQNLRYEIHDRDAGMDFDYSHRQANYRDVDLTEQDYARGKMLIQYMDENGKFNQTQLRLIRELGLSLPDDRIFSDLARTLRSR